MDKSCRTEILMTSIRLIFCNFFFKKNYFLGAGPGSPAGLCRAGLSPFQLRVMEQMEG